jgi:hypothetical protein
MKKQNSRYGHFDRAIIRTPLFPLGALQKPEDFVSSKEFDEAILVASPELYRAKHAASKSSKDKDKAEKTTNSLYKYFSRSSTRCTPFGLFAGCSVVPIHDGDTNIELSTTSQYLRVTRLDMQYLCALIRDIENRPGIRPLLRFYPNDSLYSIAGQLRYVEYHYKNTRRTHQIASIEHDEYATVILDAAAKGLKPHDLALLLVDDEIDINDALEYVDEMIDSQVLKSELDPAVVGEDPLYVLISKLQDVGESEVVGKLTDIKGILTEIDNMPIGNSVGKYSDIIEVVKSIRVGYEEKFLFQTDMFKPVDRGGISKNVVEELNDCISFLGRVNSTFTNNNLQTFKQNFLERYEQEEIPLAVALDGELGIGYPSKNGGTDMNFLVDDLALPARPSMNNHISASNIDLVLLKKYVQAIKNGDHIIHIEENDFPVKNQHAENAYPDTCSVMCSMMRDKNGDPIIYLKSAGSGGANLLGRFCHIDAGIHELVKEIAHFEGSRKPDFVIAEISHLPESRTGNISSRPVFRDVTLRYLSNTDSTVKRCIDVSDLMLSMKGDRLFLRSKQFDKEVMPQLTCAHNFSITPIPIYRFLCDMQLQDPYVGFFLQWGELFRTFDYMPRIQYKNIILSRQRWTISKDEIKDCHKLPDPELLSLFRSLMRDRNMPPHVVLPEGDNEMYIDLTDIKGLKLLLDIVKMRPTFELFEYLFAKYDSVVSSGQSGEYANEAIIVFHK